MEQVLSVAGLLYEAAVILIEGEWFPTYSFSWLAHRAGVQRMILCGRVIVSGGGDGFIKVCAIVCIIAYDWRHLTFLSPI